MRSLSVFSLALLGFCLSIASVSATTPRAEGTCYALAMSGGGDKAAYEAGVIKGLIENLPAEEVAYQVVTGISAGSTLTAAFSVYNVGDEQSVVDFVFDIIADLNQSSIFTQWPGGVVEGLLNKSSLFDSTPLRTLFTGVLGDKTLSTDRITCAGASNLRTGLFERFCSPPSIDALINHTIASAAIPGVFIPQTFQSAAGVLETYVDGGTITNVDVVGAIEQCINLGYTQEQITLDIVSCGGHNLTTLSGDPSKLTTIPVLLRAAQMRTFASGEVDYSAALHAYPNVNYRYRIFPTQPIPGSGIDFNKKEMAWMESLGQMDAINAINPPTPPPSEIQFAGL